MSEDEGHIRQVLSGEQEAFRPLVERYERPILRFILNVVGQREVAEDVAQEVFLAAYRSLGSFDADRSRFSTWLYTIARNKSLSALRRNRRASCAELVERSEKRCPSDALRGSELHEALDRALAELPAPQKTAFVLAEFEGLTYEEIARIERTRVGTVRSRISRARAKLRDTLREYEGNP